MLTNKMGEEKLSLLPELHSRIAVLKNLQYIDEDDTVTLKGRCCCFVFRLAASAYELDPVGERTPAARAAFRESAA